MFYNCFVLVTRIKINGSFKEIHVKVFNTGKLEIPGIQNNQMLYQLLDELVIQLQPFCKKKISYIKDKIQIEFKEIVRLLDFRKVYLIFVKFT